MPSGWSKVFHSSPGRAAGRAVGRAVGPAGGAGGQVSRTEVGRGALAPKVTVQQEMGVQVSIRG